MYSELELWCNADFAFDVDVMLEFWNPHSYKRISTQHVFVLYGTILVLRSV